MLLVAIFSFGKTPNMKSINRDRSFGIDDEACELVSGVELSLVEGDEDIRDYLFKAVKNAMEPANCFFQMFSGLRILSLEILHIG